jgi:hypothetical protein
MYLKKAVMKELVNSFKKEGLDLFNFSKSEDPLPESEFSRNFTYAEYLYGWQEWTNPSNEREEEETNLWGGKIKELYDSLKGEEALYEYLKDLKKRLNQRKRMSKKQQEEDDSD